MLGRPVLTPALGSGSASLWAFSQSVITAPLSKLVRAALKDGGGEVWKLKEIVVLAVNCPYCSFLTAVTLHKYSKVSLSMNGISGFSSGEVTLSIGFQGLFIRFFFSSSLFVQRQVETSVRSKILYLIQAWAHAFRNEPKYKVVQDTYQIMKVEGEDSVGKGG